MGRTGASAVLLLLASSAFRAQTADLILKNGLIWTADPARPWAQAIAIRSNQIIAAASDAEVDSLAGPGTRVEDLGGRLALPGFNDAHIHFLGGSLGLSEVDLTGARSVDAMQKRIAEYAAANPKRPWITGRGWEYACVPNRLPTRQDLDAVVRDRPAFLSAYDGHTGWANSKALELALITKESRFTGFGEIVRDPETGEPTGSLKEGAQSLVRRHIPAPTRRQQLDALEQGLNLLASLGITSIQNASGDPDTLSLYEELERAGRLTVRVHVAMSASPPSPPFASFATIAKRLRGPVVRLGGVKFMLDGVIESHTAAMLEPYSDKPGESGALRWSKSDFREAVTKADALGLPVMTHAIGDQAVRTALDAYEQALDQNGSHDARFRIEHIETVSRGDLERFAKLGVLASMQPIHADPATIDVWSRAVGPARLPLSFPWRALESAETRLVFSSDWPASISLDPIRGIHSAVNRRTVKGEPAGGWVPDQKVSLETALHAYTSGGAFASFEERVKGSIAPGFLADIVVLTADLFKLPPERIHTARVFMTVFDGRIIYRSGR